MNANTVKRIKNRYAAQRAIDLMVADMEGMWDGFRCENEIIPNKFGAWVKVYVPMEDEPDAWTAARLLRNGEEYVCIVDFYVGEEYVVTGSEGNEYIVTDCEELVAA